jgi:GNS1/SUR4 family
MNDWLATLDALSRPEGWPALAPALDYIQQPWIPPVTIAGYLVAIFALQALMTKFDIKPLNLKYTLAAHNFFLAAWSFVMCAGTLAVVGRGFMEHGRSLLAPYCGVDGSAMNTHIVFWARMFYLSKFYELLDTVFLVLRRRDLTFLHVYHHAL